MGTLSLTLCVVFEEPAFRNLVGTLSLGSPARIWFLAAPDLLRNLHMAESRKHTLLENLAFASSLRALLYLEPRLGPFASAPCLKTVVQNFASEPFLAAKPDPVEIENLVWVFLTR